MTICMPSDLDDLSNLHAAPVPRTPAQRLAEDADTVAKAAQIVAKEAAQAAAPADEILAARMKEHSMAIKSIDDQLAQQALKP